MESIKKLLFLIPLILMLGNVNAQQTVFAPSCSGVNDTAKFTAIITAIGSNTGAILLPYKNGTRCAVNTLNIPSNVTLDNTSGTGIKVNSGQTLTVAGPRVNPVGKTMFYGPGAWVLTGLVYFSVSSISDPSPPGDQSYDPSLTHFYDTEDNNVRSQRLLANSPAIGHVVNIAGKPYYAQCDGTTDDHDAFFAANAVAAAAKASLYVPPGNKCVTTTITITASLLSDGGIIKIPSGSALTIANTVTAPNKQLFDISSGGTVSFAGNKVLTTVYPEWFGGGVGVAAATNSAAIQAANDALATNTIGGDIVLGNGLYDISAALTIGSETLAAYRTINLVGQGALLSGLNWTGATNVTIIRVTQGRNNNFHDFYLKNASAKGTTVGMMLTGPGSGTQTIGATLTRVAIRGFNYGLQLGEAGGHAASEFAAYSCLFEQNNRGVYSIDQNNTNIKFDNCQFNSNISYGAYIGYGNITIYGGSSIDTGASAAGVADFYVANATAYLTVDGVRAEMNPGTMFVMSGASQNDAVINVRGCDIKAYGAFTTPLFGGPGTWNITGNSFANADRITLIFGDDPAVSPIVGNTGSSTSVTLADNTAYDGATLISVSALYNGINGLVYTLSNNQKVDSSGISAGRWANEPDGQVVWPGKLSGEHLLKYNVAVDLNTATAQTLFTNDTGRTVVITKVVISNASTSLTTWSGAFGWTSASYNDVIATATHTELASATVQTILFPKVGAKLGPSGGTFKTLATVLQGAPATCDIAIYGYFAS